ncbi:uncharacterized protein CDV56_105727 [Aspergillus thermomutatus]|uniref:Enoyl reductase (ER) domain-containing protein n=1 Tax=Aspergillus thermomutatus TaxID=41047 RepID=A0A397GLC1_ASPTH|nr:uncharacterized protein CDV56_105727 [Aspergillus thermomutatus]RHZ50518.1 hypothetical protein CDV56_105727 [Aspergillus thermomutatus]
MTSADTVPCTQVAAFVDNPGPNAHFVIRDGVAVPEVEADQVMVKLDVAGLCHSDLNRLYGHTPLIEEILGHEGVGYVVKVGSDVPGDLLNQRVGLGWLSEACQNCEICDVDYTNISGCFQQYVAANAAFVHRLPDELDDTVAAPLLSSLKTDMVSSPRFTAGITMFSAVRKANLKPGEWLLLPGAGGGLGHLGVQIAKTQGYRVIAVDTGEDKRAACMRFGATHFLDFKTDNVTAEAHRLTNNLGANAVICTAGSLWAYKQATECVRNAGTIVCVGINPSDLPISPFELVRRGLRLIGSSVGSRAQMQDLFKLAVEGNVCPLVEEISFDQIDAAARRINDGQVTGRIVMRLPN